MGILNIVDEDMNSKTHALLEYWGFHGKGLDEAWYLLERIA